MSSFTSSSHRSYKCRRDSHREGEDEKQHIADVALAGLGMKKMVISLNVDQHGRYLVELVIDILDGRDIEVYAPTCKARQQSADLFTVITEVLHC